MKVKCIQNFGFCDLTQSYRKFKITLNKEYLVLNKISFYGKTYYEINEDDDGNQFCEFSEDLFEHIRQPGERAPEII